jgi:hypothetical protein
MNASYQAFTCVGGKKMAKLRVQYYRHMSCMDSGQ